MPWVAGWTCLLAAAVLPEHDQGMQALLPEVEVLLAFMAQRGMPACLDVAAGLLAAAGEHQERGKVSQQRPAAADVAAAALGPAAPQALKTKGATTAAGHSSVPQQQLVSDAELLELAPMKPAAEQQAGGGAGHTSLLGSRQWRAGGRPAAGPPASTLGPATLLRGFPEPGTEAAYLAFKNARCAATADGVATLLCAAVVAMCLLASMWHGTPLELMYYAALLFCLPWLLWLGSSRRWYVRHREALVVVLGGAGRVANALIGVLSLLQGRDMCVSSSECFWILVLACAINFPLLQQVRLAPALALTLLDVAGLGCYAVFKTGSVLGGAAVAGLAGACGCAVSVLLERSCRAAFLRLEGAGA